MIAPLKQPVIDKASSLVDRIWLRFFNYLAPQQPAMVIETVGASPYSYQNGDHFSGVAISGGTVSQIEYSTDGVTFADTGAIAGLFTLLPFDVLRITHAGAPTMLVGYRI